MRFQDLRPPGVRITCLKKKQSANAFFAYFGLNVYLKSWGGGEQVGPGPPFWSLDPLLLTIHITIYNFTTFLTNTSYFQLKNTFEVLRTIKFSYFCAESR